MRFLKADVAGAWVVEPIPHDDPRGRFMRAWCEREFTMHDIAFVPVQENMALSKLKGTLRGLHFQVTPHLEAKLVRCTRGSIFDVVLDLRPDSPTFRSWYGAHLSGDDGRMMYVPEGCAHGCQSLEDDTEISYLASAHYAPDAARGIRHDDPAFGIAWPLEVASISIQDRSWPLWNPT
jgi:dTDP-4-dehydrorhamnose 3,5-epimerase